MSDDPEIEVCPLCSVWPTGVYRGDVQCCNANCALHSVAIPLEAWDRLSRQAERVRDAERERLGLTEPEMRVMVALVEAANAYAALGDDDHPANRADFVHAIHQAQNILASRVVRRIFPGWS